MITSMKQYKDSVRVAMTLEATKKRSTAQDAVLFSLWFDIKDYEKLNDM